MADAPARCLFCGIAAGVERAWQVYENEHAVAALLRDRLRPDGLTLFQANGAASWQTVFHMHVHLIPRHAGDPLTASWKPQTPTEEELDEVLVRIRSRT